MAKNTPPPATRSLAEDERSVSEVLGYIIVFGIVLTAIIAIVVGGVPILEDARDTSQVENAERAFDITASNFADLYEQGAPSRATQIDLGAGNLYYDNNVTITVNNGGDTLGTAEFRPVVMSVTDNRNVIYEGGAVFRGSPGEETMRRDPPFLLEEDDRALIPLVKTHSSVVESAGSRTILLRGVAEDRDLTNEDDTQPGDIEIVIESPRYDAWAQGLERQTDAECDTEPDDNEAICELDLDGDSSVYVTKHQIELQIIL